MRSEEFMQAGRSMKQRYTFIRWRRITELRFFLLNDVKNREVVGLDGTNLEHQICR